MRYSEPVEVEHREAEPLSRCYRDEDMEYDPGKPRAMWRGSWTARFSGWRGGVLASIVVTAFVLLLNVILVIVATTVWDPKDGIATAFTGDCTKAARWTTALHLLINLLGSLLLGASNYCMQRLVAPTRKEIDEAHAKRKWLDIGVPSIRNLSSINKGRVGLWILLGLSSLPLHLIYNSAVFETIATNNVAFLTVAPEFFTVRNSWSIEDISYGLYRLNVTTDNFVIPLQEMLLDGKYLDRTRFENVTGSECVKRYASPFITMGSGFAVLDAEHRYKYGYNGSNSVVGLDIGSGELLSNGPNHYDYCLCEIVPANCKVQFSTTILSLVIAANVIKVILMALVLWRLNEPTVVTIGDAIQSFLARPDPTTENCCLMSKHNVDVVWKSPEIQQNQRFKTRKREPWFSAISVRRWSVSIALYISTIAVAVGLAGLVISRTSRSVNGFGRVDVSYIIDISLPFGEQSIIPYVLLANLPQAVASFSYITYNGLFTYMLANREWTAYAMKRASLRVTLPISGQRSTHFLQLPYVWSIPLLVASILLHWFISQTIFLARIATYKSGALSAVDTDLMKYRYKDMASSGDTFFGLGYSNVALFTTISWAVALVVTCLLVATICTYPKGLAVGGTNSAVISAACHLRYENEPKDKTEEHITVKPLMWGVTIPGDQTDRIGHCSFSSGEVEPPQAGCLYAGLARRKV